jgi:hypothetical protein
MDFFTALIVDVTQRSVPEGVLDCRELRMRVGWARRREGSPKEVDVPEICMQSCSLICISWMLPTIQTYGDKQN